MFSAKFDGKVIIPAVPITAIIDTGTTYLVVDKTSYQNLLNIVKAIGITVHTVGYNSSLYKCKKSDCSDFLSI
jgi:hypothetical protein